MLYIFQLPLHKQLKRIKFYQVFLDYNDLDAVAQESFVGLTDLRTLSLKHNKILSIDERAFIGIFVCS